MSTRTQAKLVIICLLTACALTAGRHARGASFYLTTDIPSTLGGVFFAPSDIIRFDPIVYNLVVSLPTGTPVNAVYRTDGGDWLLSVAWPVFLGGVMYDPRDVILYDGISYSRYLAGSAAGIPSGSSVDAVFLRGGDSGVLVLSFNVPTTIAGTTYEPADLVMYIGGVFSILFDASATSPPVPRSSNVTGADVRGALTILTFDVPTTLGVNTYQPGELVSWDGMKFASFWSDPAWPGGSRIDGVAFLADPGMVPPTMRMRKSVIPGAVILEWQESCSSGAEGYGIYEGRIGDWYGYYAMDCRDDGADLVEEIMPSGVNRYYLVVPWNPNDEGSYGLDSDEVPRPAGDGACITPSIHLPCP